MHQPKLGRKKGNRELLVKNLATSLLLYERITTTTAKAKMLQSYVERLISKSIKLDKVNGLRFAIAGLGNKIAAKKLIEVVKINNKNRKSGFTRIINVDPRKGDSANMAIIELTEKTDIKPKKIVGDKKPAKETTKK